jgi:D-amino peptidase
MMQGVDESFDAAFLIGYHAGAGQSGVLSHTYDGAVCAARLNGMAAGEITINAALAGYFGVPIALVTGDSAACREAESVLPGVATVAVKTPITRYSANCLNPKTAREQIRAAAAQVLGRIAELEPFTIEPPIRFELAFNHVGFADRAAIMPGTARLDPITVAYQSDDYVTAYQGFLTMLVLAESIG